jgi:nucleoside-diphosphate-sugar epimerase
MLNAPCVLITGANGFVGQQLMSTLSTHGVDVIGALRSIPISNTENVVAVGNINSTTNWSAALTKVQVVIHTAARAHIMKDSAPDILAAYREVNTAGTLNLARQAADAGVKRFIFISSIKVNGETTTKLPAFTEYDIPSPLDPYGISKMEAEEGLLKLSKNTGMEVVIIRPPLVYGAGVKANFHNLMKLADTCLPLPFGAIHNMRSMIYVHNLVDFIRECIDHPAAANQVFLLSDGQDFSLTQLVTLLRSFMCNPRRLIPIPVLVFRIAGLLVGKNPVVDRLVGSLQVDADKARKLLGWVPPYTVEQGIQATVGSFMEAKK